jgi:hypothetical protein
MRFQILTIDLNSADDTDVHKAGGSANNDVSPECLDYRLWRSVHSHLELGRELNRKLSWLLADKTRAT